MRKIIATVIAAAAISVGLTTPAQARPVPDQPVICPPGTTLNHYGRCVGKGIWLH